MPDAAPENHISRIPAENGLPAAAYVSPAWYDDERARVLRAGWLCLGRADEIPQPGDYAARDLLGEPLVMLRGEDDELRVFSRVCRHRGMDLISGEGNTRRFTCPYHAWTYDLAGRLTAAPLMERTIGFDPARLGLRQFPAEVWQGFVFVNLSGDAPALSTTANALSRRLANYRLDEMRLLRKLDFDCPWNWKVMVENYMECYHHLAAHRTTLQKIIPAHKTWCEETDGPYALCHMPYRSDVDVVAYKADAKEAGGENQALPAILGLNEAERRRGTLVHLFPTHVMVVYPERMDYLLIDPIGPERTRVTACFCLPEGIARAGDHEAAIDEIVLHFIEFTREDFVVCERVQRGLRAPSAELGPLSFVEASVRQFKRYVRERIFAPSKSETT
jgi:phenylpropionate dioxygenase-like ring-hydroxylating dioxygenase large terminal subunit